MAETSQVPNPSTDHVREEGLSSVWFLPVSVSETERNKIMIPDDDWCDLCGLELCWSCGECPDCEGWCGCDDDEDYPDEDED